MHPKIPPDNANREFHTLSLPLARRLTRTEQEIIDKIIKKLKSDRFFFEKTASALVFHYHSLDFDRFKNGITGIMNEYVEAKDDEIDRALFTGLVSAIEGIRSYGIRNGKRVYVNYNAERKVNSRQDKVQKRCLHYYAADNGFSREEKKCPAKFVNKIVCGDSATVLKKIPSNSIDLVLTSPPYNFGMDYGKSEDGILWDDYFEKLFTIFSECIRIVKYGGRIIVNVQPLFSDYIPIHHIISNFFMERKLIWKGEILWEKNNYNCKYTAWGSWKSPANPYLKYTWEFVEIFCKGALKKSGDREQIDISADEFKQWVVAKWSIAPERSMKEFDHPAMFPEELVGRILKLFSFKNDIILDPFSGVGTTAAVAKRLGRRYIGIEISEDYCAIAEERLDR